MIQIVDLPRNPCMFQTSTCLVAWLLRCMGCVCCCQSSSFLVLLFQQCKTEQQDQRPFTLQRRPKRLTRSAPIDRGVSLTFPEVSTLTATTRNNLQALKVVVGQAQGEDGGSTADLAAACLLNCALASQSTQKLAAHIPALAQQLGHPLLEGQAPRWKSTDFTCFGPPVGGPQTDDGLASLCFRVSCGHSVLLRPLVMTSGMLLHGQCFMKRFQHLTSSIPRGA